MFLRGPQPVTCATRVTVFEHFFWSHFLMPFWSQMVSPREPKIAQNRQKSCSRGLPESTRQKVTKNDAIWEGWICNPHTPVQSKHTFSFSRFGQKSDPKSLPKWSLGAPQITKNQEKWALKKTLKKLHPTNIKNDLKTEVLFRGGNVSKITKSEPWA